MKERAPSTQQQSKGSRTAGSSSSSEGREDRHCVMTKELERHVKDMHAKAGPSATPSLRNIKV